MSQALVTQDQQSAVPIAYTGDWVKLVKNTVAKGATDDELKLFLYQCKKSGLDPLAKQIYFRKQNSKSGPQVSIQTGIDGYRLIADRTGLYAGNDDPVFDDEEKPRKATVTVWKIVNGVRCPYTATARWDQYYPGDAQGFMWRKMPHLMLGKCAEALALRKAFPAELSGLYTTDEMAQAMASHNEELARSKEREDSARAELARDMEEPRKGAKPAPQATIEAEVIDGVEIPFGSPATKPALFSPDDKLHMERLRDLVKKHFKKGEMVWAKDLPAALKGIALEHLDNAVKEWLEDARRGEAQEDAQGRPRGEVVMGKQEGDSTLAMEFSRGGGAY